MKKSPHVVVIGAGTLGMSTAINLAEQGASVTVIEAQAKNAGLSVTETNAFGRDYAETLRRWRATFLESWPTIESGKFDDEFRRTWEFYLAYCEAGFRTGYLDVAQVRLEPLGSTRS